MSTQPGEQPDASPCKFLLNVVYFFLQVWEGGRAVEGPQGVLRQHIAPRMGLLVRKW